MPSNSIPMAWVPVPEEGSFDHTPEHQTFEVHQLDEKGGFTLEGKWPVDPQIWDHRRPISPLYLPPSHATTIDVHSLPSPLPIPYDYSYPSPPIAAAWPDRPIVSDLEESKLNEVRSLPQLTLSDQVSSSGECLSDGSPPGNLTARLEEKFTCGTHFCFTVIAARARTND